MVRNCPKQEEGWGWTLRQQDSPSRLGAGVTHGGWNAPWSSVQRPELGEKPASKTGGAGGPGLGHTGSYCPTRWCRRWE